MLTKSFLNLYIYPGEWDSDERVHTLGLHRYLRYFRYLCLCVCMHVCLGVCVHSWVCIAFMGTKHQNDLSVYIFILNSLVSYPHGINFMKLRSGFCRFVCSPALLCLQYQACSVSSFWPVLLYGENVILKVFMVAAEKLKLFCPYPSVWLKVLD